MATILEALQNARVNLVNHAGSELGLMIGSAQLDNAIALLEKGYSIDDDVEERIGSRESVHDVPQALMSTGDDEPEDDPEIDRSIITER